jgi:hypothetical protein
MTPALFAAVLITVPLCWTPVGAASERLPDTQTSSVDRGYAVTLYHNVLSADPLEDLLTGHADFDSDYQLTALALSRIIETDDPRYDYEWEVQLATHSSGQSHEELNALLAARWYPLPWDAYLNTDFAVGLGLSYATERPPFEAQNHPHATQLLAYILLELEFRPQATAPWSFVLRSHHRSGAFGLFDGVRGASNSLGLGVKYRF